MACVLPTPYLIQLFFCPFFRPRTTEKITFPNWKKPNLSQLKKVHARRKTVTPQKKKLLSDQIHAKQQKDNWTQILSDQQLPNYHNLRVTKFHKNKYKSQTFCCQHILLSILLPLRQKNKTSPSNFSIEKICSIHSFNFVPLAFQFHLIAKLKIIFV